MDLKLASVCTSFFMLTFTMSNIETCDDAQDKHIQIIVYINPQTNTENTDSRPWNMSIGYASLFL